MNIKCLKVKKNGSFAFLISKPIVERRMASEDLIFTSSSDSEDSKVNFIADYVLEVEGSPFSAFSYFYYSRSFVLLWMKHVP